MGGRVGMGELGSEGLGIGLPPGWSAHPDSELAEGRADLSVWGIEVAGVNRHLGKQGVTFLNMRPDSQGLCPKASWARLGSCGPSLLPVSAASSLSSEAAMPRAWDPEAP